MATTNTQLAATLHHRQKGYVNQILKQNALWAWLRKKKRYKVGKWGNKFEIPVETAFDLSEPSFTGLENRPYEHQDNVTLATYNWKYYDKHIVIGTTEKLENQGDQKAFDLLEQKEQNALFSLQTQFNLHSYLDGTGNSSKRITGLAAIIAEDPTTGTLAGINRATAGNEYWRNQNKDTGAAFNSGVNSRALINDAEQLRIECGRIRTKGRRYPDLILSTERYFLMYMHLLQPLQRYQSTEMLNAGFNNVKFHDAMMIEDQDCPQDVGSNEKAFFINSDHLEVRVHSGGNFDLVTKGEHDEQHSFHQAILWGGEIATSLPAKHGIHQGLAEPS